MSGRHDERVTPVAVAIMAKAPRPGEVKTRLCPPLAPEDAAALYRCFLLDKIAQVRTVSGAAALIAYAPASARREFQALAPGLRLHPQRGEDLGARLLSLLSELLAEGHAAAVAVDSDTPTLPARLLQDAVDRLSRPGPDVVLGPTDDGGYYLIGVRAARRELFEGIAWSTPAVLRQTLERAGAAGLSAECLTPWFDVDTPGDLARLQTALAAADDGPAAHTARFLAASSLPPPGGVVHHGSHR